MKRLVSGLVGLVMTIGVAPAAMAQQAWVQIEAQSGAAAARRAAETYASRLDDVASFRLGATNWYAIAVGPFDPTEAQSTRARLLSQGAIPRDSFINEGASFRAQVWPDEGDARADEGVRISQADTGTSTQSDAAQTAAPPPVDESPAEARQSERDLTGQQRRQLQIALEWAGFYDAGIDGAFGSGTRAAMRAWQAANGYDQTGVLTTRQRRELRAQYNAVLEGLDVGPVTDRTAGITVAMPRALVAFDRHEPPFAHYEPTDAADGHKVILISQSGGRPELYGLYDILQTLEIVPPEGERERRERGFTLIGRGDEFVSQTEAQLRDGHVKGFTLVWPAGDEERRTRVVQEMIASFETDPDTVMPDMVGDAPETQSVDLLAGLKIRKPRVARSGFFVDNSGTVLTTADAAEGCGRITLNADIEADVVAADTERGLALLRPSERLSPRARAAFQSATPRLQSDAILAGFSFDGQLGAPSLVYGALADLRDLEGDERVDRYALSVRPGDAGGPIFDRSGAVLGMLLPPPSGARSYPEGTAFAADTGAVNAFLRDNGIEAETQNSLQRLPRGQLERRATDMTVLVGCWD